MNEELQRTLQLKYESSLELEQRVQIADQQIDEINQVVSQLKELNGEGFLPLGQAVFVKAEAKNNFLVGVGAGVFIEKTREEAIEGCERRSVLLAGLKNRMTNQLGELAEEMRKIIQKTI